jgi:uncharacterized membrane protein (UPF0127 family)
VSADFARTVIEVGGVPYTVAVADTPEKLVQGLMGVEELSPLDGMLFIYDTERLVSHWMQDTFIPLDIAFFDAEGFFVSKASMPTCLDGECPRYPSDGTARYALEVPFGGLEGLATGARLVLIDALDGNGKEI